MRPVSWSDATPERLTQALADRYRLEHELGQGDMATEYLAHDVKHDRQVAIKVLRPELATVIGAERFLAEIKTTANLQHPRILPFFDCGVVDGTVFCAMPFVEGESLRDRSTQTGTPEVYVRRFLAEGRAIRLTTSGACSPRWRADGREFCSQTSDGWIMAMPVTPGGDLSNAMPLPRFFAPAYSRTMLFDRGTSVDVTSDGTQFALRMAASDNHAVLVQNWPAKLDQR